MSNKEISEPQQKRAIEKKKRIVHAGFSLFCEKGFHKTNTAEIAKKAGVSTGIVYRYFPDKRAIFIDSLPLFFEHIYSKTYITLQELAPPLNYESTFNQMIDTVVASHNFSKSAHEEMMVMCYSDDTIRDYFLKAYRKINLHIADTLFLIGIRTDNLYEKVHIIVEMVESYCHEFCFSRDEALDYEVIKKLLIKTIMQILEIK